MAVHPENPDIVYVGAVGSSPGGGGALQRYDHRSRQIQLVNVWPELHGGIGPGELTYRFPWTYPILFSPHDSSVLYTAGNHVFKSTDEGSSWEPISPDLTRNDPVKLAASGGPITKDTSGAEHYCTIATLRESAHEQGVFWAGSDDGLVHLSRDGGETWEDITPTDLPEWSFIRTVEPSPHDPATVYLAATRYKLDDPAPYLYKSTDYGHTWDSITGVGEHALPADDFVRVIREDPVRQGLLYVGTETGLYVSLDDGVTWQRWESTLPVTPIYDLEVKDADLVVGTHGRSFWIMDDLTTPLRELAMGIDGPHLFTPQRAWRVLPDLFHSFFNAEGKDYWLSLGKAATYVAARDESGQLRRTILDAGQSNPIGSGIVYNLDEDSAGGGAVTLALLDSDGELVRELRPKPEGYDEFDEDDKAVHAGPWITTKPGINRFLWDLRYDGSTRLRGNKLAGEANLGPLVVPGTYRVELRVDGAAVQEATFEVVNDPRSDVTQEALEDQLRLLLDIRDTISDAHTSIARLRAVSEQVVAWRSRLEAVNGAQAAAVEMAESIKERLDRIEDELIVPGYHKDTFGLNERSRLHEKLASIISVVASADARPTAQARELAGVYGEQIRTQLAALDEVLDGDLAEFNELIKAADLPAVG